MIDITSVAVAVITLLVTIMTVFVIPVLRAKFSDEQLLKIQTWVNIAVGAAEQLYQGTDMGATKKQFVLTALSQHGFTIDPDLLDQMIEAAVNELPKVFEPVVEIEE